MLLSFARDDLYLLLPSDFGALLSVFVEALRLRDGIMEAFIDFTLTERASDALVGVVMALGRFVDGAVLAGVDGICSFSGLLSLDIGRAVEVSSSMFFLTRLPGAVFSKRPVSRRDFVEVDFGRFVSTHGSSRPALELLRFREVALVCSLFFHVEA